MDKYKNSGLSREQIDLALAIFGQDGLDRIIQEGKSLTKALEQSGLKFKSMKKEVSDDILQMLETMPGELVTEDFLNRIQTWVNRQLREFKQKSIEHFRNVPGETIFFSGNDSNNVRTKVKKTNDFSLSNFIGSK